MLLERDIELAGVTGLVEAAAAGRGGAVAVLGPAGIGKSSLLGAARELAVERGLTCLTARGGELERNFAFGVVRQLLEGPLRALSSQQRRTVFSGAAALSAPVLEAGTDDDGASNSAFAVVHGLYWTCVNLAERGPLLLTVDDLHWADAGSLRFLAYVVRRIEDLPLVVLLGARPTLPDDRAELMDAVTAAQEVRVVRPAPLTQPAVAQVIEAGLGRALGDDLARHCWQATGGNPLLAEALASAIAEDEALATDGARIAELAGRAVSTVVMARLGRLPEDAAALARAVAILGTDADLRQAAALSELGDRAAATAADLLATQGILSVGRPLEFVHPLVRAAVTEQLPTAERMLAHARAARVVDASGAPPDAVAAHLLGAEPAADAWVVERLGAAARAAMRSGSPEAAVSYLDRALREPPPAQDRGRLLRELGEAEFVLGDAQHAAEHFREARQLAGDATERARITLDLATAISTAGRFPEAITVLEETLRDTAVVDTDVALQLEGVRSIYADISPGSADASAPFAERAGFDPEGRTAGERAYLSARVTRVLTHTLDGPGKVREWARRAIEGGVAADLIDHPFVWANLAYPLIFSDGFKLLARMTEDGLEEARRRGSLIGVARACQARAMLRLREGALPEAVADARLAVDTGRQVGLATRAISLGALVEALTLQGEYDQADAALAEDNMEGEVPLNFLFNWVLHGRAQLRLAQGRRGEAIADLTELRRREETWNPWNPAVFAYRSDLALALGEDERERALALAKEELELALRYGTARAIGISQRTLGLLEADLDLLGASVDTLAESPARLEHARSLVELGAATRRAGSRAAARDPLHTGMELAHRCGAEPLVSRAREELVATGARPRRIMRSGVDALTPSELRVARMAAEGMTNREIAQALFITLRTAEAHLSHAYQKLDIVSRDALPAALAVR